MATYIRGAYFLEAWSSDGTNFNTNIYYFDDNSVAGGYVDPPWYLKFPPGRHSSGKALPNGLICTSPWDTGTIHPPPLFPPLLPEHVFLVGHSGVCYGL